MNSAAYKLMELYNWRYSRGSTTKEYQSIADVDITLIGNNIDVSHAFVCDLGCGSGAHLVALAEAGAQYAVGIDLSTEALTHLLNSYPYTSTLLIHGDYMNWTVTEQFDALVCSLPSIEVDPQNATTKICRKLSTLLKVNGILFLKLFVREKVEALTGHYSIRYDQSGPIKVSDVTFIRRSNTLLIKQYYEDQPDAVLCEELYLPSLHEITSSLSHSAMDIVQIFSPEYIEDNLSIPGTVSLLAKKR